MMREQLLTQLGKRTLLADGAMGTQLLEAGLATGQPGAAWNLTSPERIQAIQTAYVEAGAEILITNSFQASPLALARHGLADKAYELNLRAARIARDCIGAQGYVLGDVGPFGGFLEPLGTTSRHDLAEAFGVQVAGLRDGGVDGIIIETMTALDELEVAIQAVRAYAPRLPLVASVTFDRMADGGFQTMTGSDVAEAVNLMTHTRVDVLGCNCGTGLHIGDYVHLVDEIRRCTDKPLMLQPNAGQPRLDGGRIVYDESPERMASEVKALVRAGVAVVGGCCGTTPKHIRLFRRELDNSDARGSSRNRNWCPEI